MSHRGGSGQRSAGQGRGGGGTPTRGYGSPGSQRGRGSPALSNQGSGRSTPAYDSGGRGGHGRGFEPRGRGGPDRGRGGFGGGGGGSRGRGAPGGPVIFSETVPAHIPDRLSDKNHQQLISTFGSVKLRPERPLRPGYGTIGTPITLRANFFPVTVPKGPIYDYVVEISPKTDVNRLKIRIFQLLELSPACQQYLPHIAHDRSQRLVSSRKLPQPLDIAVPFYDDGESGPRPGGRVYTVSIKFDRELDMNRLNRYMDGQAESRDYDPLPLVSALNLVLQQHPSRTGVRVGKNRYFFPNAAHQPIRLGPGIIAQEGFYTSVRTTFKQLMVNVNVCMTAFIEPGNLADILIEFNRGSHGAMPRLPPPFVKSLRVHTTHLGHKKAVKLIGTTSARNTKFDCPEYGGKISVESFFKKKYNIQLKYPVDLPVIDLGSKTKSVWVPAELCFVDPGNAYRGKLSDKEVAEMIRYACNPPKYNAERIVGQGLPILGLVPPQQPINGFGVAISTEMAVVPGRELLPPRLTYRVGQAKVQNGSWNIMDVKFHQGASASSWWVLVVRDGRRTIQGPDDQNLQTLVQSFSAKLKNSGMNVPSVRPRLLPPCDIGALPREATRANALDLIRKVIKDEVSKVGKPSFILVLLENRDNFIYPGIKRIGDVELGIHTIHMQLAKAFNEPRKQDQYLSNIALKVNTKLGGMNHLLENQAMKWLTRKKTMMVGIDVTHPGPGSQEGTPSIAAVVASVDDSFVQFPASLRIQQSKKEMLDELRDMMIERLQVYEKKNRTLPQRIFVYRDGVSEGQFDTVLEEELVQILEAFKKLSTKDRKEPYRPSLSIIICGKRHHAKFYATNSQYADRNGNTRPGTVVDKGVTGVFDFDFYLQAHAGLQGNVKATHYTVVYDENKLTADEIQQGTHDTSYLYARATKAVSLIPAAYYADLACERGRCYLNDFLDDRGSSSGRGRLDKDEEAARVFAAARASWGQGLHPDIRGTMFYI
ncbi:argonaute-like protein [Crucibulum laeve]|uniref:Argonaute-like protein n=1 Tax=Crucibulum laeve TaxID=68775 RepID=A0A5C3LSK0_9AGAR|nr:argonaute-like protein [Crucibulum laeve]